MRIGQKLVLSFSIVASLIWGVGFFAVTKSQKALQESIGESSVSLAVEVLNEIDKTIRIRIEEYQAYSHTNSHLYETLEKSNQEFDNLNNRQEYIKAIDRDWKEGKDTPFIQGILKNKLSERLRKRTKFYEKHQGYNVFPEVYATNKYGVIIASTGKTSDYLQADEEWYQKAAEEEAFWIGDVEYDESSDTYACDIVVNLYDDDGKFSGIIKAVYNIEEVINIIKRAEALTKYNTTEFKLCTEYGKIIYSTEKFVFFDNIPDKLLSHFESEEHMEYFIAKGDERDEGKELFAYAHSRGYKDYKGLGWNLIVEHETEEIFAPVAELKNLLLIIASVVTILGVLIGLFISRSISTPLTKLERAAIEIGKGKLDTNVEIDSTNEIGQLAGAFNKMTENLQVTTTSIDNLNAVNQQLSASEQQLKATNQKLESEISERKQAEEKLQETLADIERFNQLMIVREERVIEMKKEVNSLLAELGREPQYKSVLKGEEVGISSDKAG